MSAAAPARDLSLDVARGIAIVAVVLGHVVSGLIDAGAPGASAWSGDLNRALYLTHLPVFAFLTGLLMPRGVERRGQWAYLRERLELLLYLYLLWTLIQGTVEVAASGVTNRPTTWSDVFTIWTPLAHLWFLPALAVATGVVVLVRPWRGGIGSGIALLAVAAGSLAAWGWNGPVAGVQGLALLGWFTLGAAVTHARYVSVLGQPPVVLLLVAAVSTSALLIVVAAAGHVTLPTVTDGARSVGSVALGAMGSVAGVATVVAIAAALAARWPAVAGLLAVVGKQSLAIYLAHIIFAAGTREMLEVAGVTDFVVVMVVATMVGVAGPLTLERAMRSHPWLFVPIWRSSARSHH